MKQERPSHAGPQRSGAGLQGRRQGAAAVLQDLVFIRLREPVARSIRVLALSVLAGVLAGLGAAGLDAALEFGASELVGRFASPASASILQLRWQILLLPALGGLASGVIVLVLARNTRGHGTDQLVHAFHHRDGHLELRGPLVKAGATVGVISCGGSAGPEGPIAALGAAIGSTLARLVDLSPREQRVLLLAGCAGGVGAIFGCPLGGALFATSILYRQPGFESDSLVPAFVASVVSYSTFMAFDRYGSHMLKHADTLVFQSPVELPVYLLLGIACGLVAIMLSATVNAVEHLTGALRVVPIWLRPALGGLLTGAVALALPQVMDGQYRFVQNALDGSLFATAPDWTWRSWAVLFALVTIGKCLATAFTVGSGASGGLLGPSVFIGGLVGAFVGATVEALLPSVMPEAVRAALIPVGMAGVLAAAMRIPIASMVMVIEMTGSYGLVVPLMLVTTTAYLVGRRRGLIDAQVPSPAESPAHAGDAIVNLLESYLVRDVMERNWPLMASPGTPLHALLARLETGMRPHFAVVDGDRLVGIISTSDILHLADEPDLAHAVVADDIMTRRPITIDPEHTLYEALRIFQERSISILPVVANGRRRRGARLLGMLARDDVYALVRRHMNRIRQHVLHEHAGLGAIDQDNTLHHLLAGMPAPEMGTVERLPVPRDLVGHSLIEADFRNVYHAEVLALQTASGDFVCPPDPQRPLDAGDQLIVLNSTGGQGIPGGAARPRSPGRAATEPPPRVRSRSRPVS